MMPKLKITRKDLPALYHAASVASGDAQRNFLILIGINVLCLLIGALSSSILIDTQRDPASFEYQLKSFLSLISAGSLGISIIVTIATSLIRFEKDWYGGRAIAESVKTLAWRFMMCSEPYRNSNPNAEKEFINDLKEILKERKYLSGALGGPIGTLPQVTEMMRNIRKMNISERLKIYLDNRIDGQKEWYSGKSLENQKWGDRIFLGIIIIQSIALLVAIHIVQNINAYFNPTGILTTLAAGLLTWTQVKQYRNLAQSYGLTTQELGLIKAESKTVLKNDQLSSFVNDSEKAISREHTMWLARKSET